MLFFTFCIVLHFISSFVCFFILIFSLWFFSLIFSLIYCLLIVLSLIFFFFFFWFSRGDYFWVAEKFCLAGRAVFLFINLFIVTTIPNLRQWGLIVQFGKCIILAVKQCTLLYSTIDKFIPSIKMCAGCALGGVTFPNSITHWGISFASWTSDFENRAGGPLRVSLNPEDLLRPSHVFNLCFLTLLFTIRQSDYFENV